ncbi:MAG: helix-turn-helix transcriptional regulator [Cyclobacteriaceae bacterium]
MIRSDSDIDSLYEHIGSRIKDIRQKHELNQKDFGEKVNLSRASIVNIEKGKQRPTIHFLYFVCALFKEDIGKLFPPYMTKFDQKVNKYAPREKDLEALEDLLNEQD